VVDLSFRRFFFLPYKVHKDWRLRNMARLSTEKREEMPSSEYACPIDKKLPINDAAHVRNAMARFDQVITNKCHPAQARERILAAAKKYGVDVKEFGKVKEFKSASREG
jgi:hypothetical protein